MPICKKLINIHNKDNMEHANIKDKMTQTFIYTKMQDELLLTKEQFDFYISKLPENVLDTFTVYEDANRYIKIFRKFIRKYKSLQKRIIITNLRKKYNVLGVTIAIFYEFYYKQLQKKLCGVQREIILDKILLKDDALSFVNNQQIEILRLQQH